MSESHRRTVSYIDKSREYYAAHGYEKPYMWARYESVPFAGPKPDLADLRVGVVTTTFPVGSPMPKRAYARPSAPIPQEMFTADLSWDKDATHTDDVGSFLPLAALNAAARAGEIGSASPRFYGVPTEYSQRRSRADATQVLRWAMEDNVDVMLLVPL